MKVNKSLRRRCAFLLCLFLLSGCLLAPTAMAKEETRSVSDNHVGKEQSVSDNHADEEQDVSDSHADEGQGISDNDSGGFFIIARIPDAGSADEEKLFRDIAEIDGVELCYAGTDGKPTQDKVLDGDLLEKDTRLAVKYTYTITADKFRDSRIVANIPYYLDISPHLKLPGLVADGEPLMIKIGNEEEKEFGRIHADDSRAYITFTPNNNGTGIALADHLKEGSDFADFEGAYFYLGCGRADDPTGDPIEGSDNRYEMVLEDQKLLTFGYAEHEPVKVPATIKKDGGQDGNSNELTWTITYKPWENPSKEDGVGTDSLFEVRDTIDGSVHEYQDGSAKINVDGTDITCRLCHSRSDIPADCEAYLLIEEVEKAGGNGTVKDTVLVFGGKKFAAAASTKGNPVKPLTITYKTVVKKELLLPGTAGGNKVKNAADLFVKKDQADGDFDKLDNAHAEKEVTVKQPEWITKAGTTVRDPGNGSETVWTVTLFTNGFSLDELEDLKLHDVLPGGSALVGNKVKVKVGEGTEEEVSVELSEGDSGGQLPEGGFTVPLSSLSGTGNVVITYTTKVLEETYEKGEDLGKNTVQAFFSYDGTGYQTKEAAAPVGSATGSGGSSSTATLLKSAGAYDTKTRTIKWTVTINQHKANLISGTFTDDLSKVGVQAGVCRGEAHRQGLELVKQEADGKWQAVSASGDVQDCVKVLADGQPVTSDMEKYIDLSYDENGQILTMQVKKDGENVIGQKTITLTYSTRVCDPCIFANNTAGVTFKNRIVTEDMQIGSQTGLKRAAEATAPVKAAVLTKKPPVYHYGDGTMTWTIEVDAAGLPMTDVALEDVLPAGLSYVSDPDTLTTSPVITGASVRTETIAADGQQRQKLTIDLGDVNEKTSVIFRTKVDPEAIGFGGSGSVTGKNGVSMTGKADGIEFIEVSHEVTYSFANHGLVKNSTQVNETEEWIQYEVLIDPYHLKLPARPKIVDTLDSCLQLDRDTLYFYRAGSVTGDVASGSGTKPGYVKAEDSRESLTISGYDPEKNSFTVVLPIAADSTDAYVLTYRADIISRQAGGYGNSVRFEGENVSLGGDKNNNASVGGGGGGGGGVAARKAMLRIRLTGKNGEALAGVPFILYLWDGGNNRRGMAFAQAVSDADGNLTFRVPPGKEFELVQTGKDEGHDQQIKWDDLPTGVQGSASGIRFTAGTASSELSLVLKNEPLPDGGSGGGNGSGGGDGGSGGGNGSGSDNGSEGAFGGSGDAGDASLNAGLVNFETFLPGDSADLRARAESFPAAGFDTGPLALQRGGFTDVPRTGDSTPKLFAAFAVSGILTATVTICRFVKRKGQKGISKAFYGLLLLAFSCSCIMFAVRLVNIYQGNHFYERIKGESSGDVSRTETETREDIERITADSEEGEKERETVPPMQKALVKKLSVLSGEYPETVAWLQIPGTSVDYPVMLGYDNTYYLNHLPDGEKNVMGSLFLDCRTGLEGPHLIVYGHNMADGKMFGLLKQYEAQDYFADHKTVTVATADAEYVCPIFSVRRVETDEYVYRMEFKDQETLTDYAAQAAAESLYPIDADLDNIRSVVTLSTCTSNSRQRLVVQAALPEE